MCVITTINRSIQCAMADHPTRIAQMTPAMRQMTAALVERRLGIEERLARLRAVTSSDRSELADARASLRWYLSKLLHVNGADMSSDLMAIRVNEQPDIRTTGATPEEVEDHKTAYGDFAEALGRHDVAVSDAESDLMCPMPRRFKLFPSRPSLYFTTPPQRPDSYMDPWMNQMLNKDFAVAPSHLPLSSHFPIPAPSRAPSPLFNLGVSSLDVDLASLDVDVD